MNFLNHNLAYDNLRDCILITKNGTKVVVNIDSLDFFGDGFPKFEGCIKNYCQMDLYRTILNSTYGTKASKTNYIPEIKNVIFNDPATIVFWEDGTKTVVKCQDGDEFDPEKGLAMAIAKKAYGNKGNYCNKMKKWLPKEEQVDTNNGLRSIFVPQEFTFTFDSDKLSKSFKKGISDALDIIFKGTKCTPDDNNVSSKKRMTFREEAAKLHPEDLIPDCKGGICGCPRDIDTCPYSTNVSHSPVSHSPSDDDCRACWDREIPDELMDND